jgi:glycerol kinase
MARFILALDQGTTSSRAILFDRHGAVAGIEQQEFTQHFPQSGYVEHDAMEIWQSQLTVARKLLKKQSVNASDIAAIGITNQRETTVVWDKKTGEPVYHALVWQDRRTAPLCDALREQGKAPLFQEKTGLILDAYFSATKLAWLLDNVPNLRTRAERGELAFGTIDSWLVYRLCGEHVTDVSNASRTMLFNIHTLRWDDALLTLLDIPASMLPRVVASSQVIATTQTDLFGAPIPIAGLIGDQQAAAFGQTCFTPGMAKNTYGTGCFLLMHTGNQAVASGNRLLSTVGWSLERPKPASTHYMVEGSIFVGGAVVQWLRDGLGIIEQSSDIEALAASVKDNGDVYFVPAFTGLGTPYWDPYARGSLYGLTRGTTKAHIARAALESIAFQTADVLAAMQQDAARPINELRVDGGAAANNLLLQFQADILNVPVTRPKVTETTALGAAYMAGLATGFWESTDALSALWQADRTFTPNMQDDKRAELAARWHSAVQRSMSWTT